MSISLGSTLAILFFWHKSELFVYCFFPSTARTTFGLGTYHVGDVFAKLIQSGVAGTLSCHRAKANG
jgi:hypothetical protein